MSQANKRGWDRKVLAERVGGSDAARRVVTEAEFYLAAGQIARRRLRRGCRPKTIARALGISMVEALTAQRYAESSPALILRALVEDWSWEQIKHCLGHQPDFDARRKSTP